MPMLKAQDAWSKDWIRRQIEALKEKGWYHSIELPDGQVLEGIQSIPHLKGRLARFPVPENLTGKRVLDIGAWDGWFSFEMERRGADVVAVDCIDMERFRLARQLLNSNVDYRILDVDELSPETVGRFDIVMFFGVLYHLRHPLLALERICQLAREMALVESFVIDEGIPPGEQPARAMLEFYETDELGGQVDNWYGPNTPCLLAMCRAAGFARVQLSEVAEQRAHVTCYRHWEPPPARPRYAPPQLTAAVNNRSLDAHFHKHKDEYICCFFKSQEPALRVADVMPELDGYGLPVINMADKGEGGWQANVRFPSGLEPGPHEVRLRTANSGYSNAVTVELHPGLSSQWL
jgi:tRNA (mo5U34)-methyltransferase